MNKDTKTQGVVYELGYHLIPLVSEDEVASHVSAIKSILDEVGAEIVSEEMPIHIELAYPISKKINTKREEFDSAYFGWIKFVSDATSVLEIDEKVKEIEEMLRFIIIKTLREDTVLGDGLASHRKEVEIDEEDNSEEAPEEEETSTEAESSEEESAEPRDESSDDIDSEIDKLVIS